MAPSALRPAFKEDEKCRVIQLRLPPSVIFSDTKHNALALLTARDPKSAKGEVKKDAQDGVA